MSEEPTGVTVHRPSGTNQINHPEGSLIRVDAAGHLHVVKNSGDVVAIYAPEKWTYAKVSP